MAILTKNYQKIATGSSRAFNNATAYLELWAKYNSQNVITARSNPQYEVRLVVSNGYIGEYSGAIFRLTGKTGKTTGDVSKGTGNFTSMTLGSLDESIQHDNSGNATAGASASINFKAWDITLTVGGSADLPKIPRASQIGVANANIGQSTVISINRYNSNFKTSLYYRVKNTETWNLIVDKTDQTSYAWLVPTSFYELIPNKPSIDVEFKGVTYNGDTEIGTSNIITGTFIATGNPEISQKTANTTNFRNLTSNNTTVIKYASNVLITVIANALNSASISKILVNNTEMSLSTSNNNTTGTLTITKSDTNIFEIQVIDSRGNSTTDNIELNNIDYIPLSISGDVARNQTTDNKVKINASGNYFNGNFGADNNSLTVQYRYRKKSDENYNNWTTIPGNSITINDNKFSITNYLVSNIDYRYIYEFELRTIDKVNTTGDSTTITNILIPKGKPFRNWCEEFFNINAEIRQNNIPLFEYIEEEDAIVFKFFNGLMMIVGWHTTDSLTWQRDSGDKISYINGLTLPNFPVEFTKILDVKKTIRGTNPSARQINITPVGDFTKKNPGTYNLSHWWGSNGDTVTVSYTAIGFWKEVNENE